MESRKHWGKVLHRDRSTKEIPPDTPGNPNGEVIPVVRGLSPPLKQLPLTQIHAPKKSWLLLRPGLFGFPGCFSGAVELTVVSQSAAPIHGRPL